MTEIKIDNENLLTLLKELIRINSANPSLSDEGNGEFQSAQYIGEYSKKLDLGIHYQKIEKGRTNVIGILKGKGGC